MSLFTVSKNSGEQPLLFNRSSAIISVLIATFIVLLFINLENYSSLKNTGQHLERALNERLITAATLSAQLLERDLADPIDSYSRTLTRITLNRIKSKNDLEAAYIIDQYGNVIIDADVVYEKNFRRSYILRDSLAINTALAGRAATSQLYSMMGSFFKNVYINLNLSEEHPLVLVLEANADFFDILEKFKSRSFIIVIESVLLFALLLLFIMWVLSQFLKTENKLQQSKRLAALGQMSATVAHEIRNPLGIIKATTDILHERSPRDAKTAELYTFIDDEIKRINILVNDFLSLSRDPDLNLKNRNISSTIRQAFTQFKNEYPEITFDLELEENICVRHDTDRIHQVLLNLFINAVDASKETKPKINLNLYKKLMRKKEFACIEIIDKGVGITGDPEKLFEPFYTTKSKGTGLGLFICRRIIEYHSGTITAHKIPKSGTKIVIRLPVRATRGENE
jgi:signal transduction histidine kinase